MVNFILALILIMLIIFEIIFSIILTSLLTKIHFNGAYFAETSDERLKTILELADLKRSDRVLDLGSGDGRIVLAIAKLGIKATGIEINPVLVLISQIKLYFSDSVTKSNAVFIQGNLWKIDASPYNVVIVYGISSMMSELKDKLSNELRPGSKLISVLFRFPSLKISKKREQIYFYNI